VKIIYIQLISNIRSQLKIAKKLKNRSAEENDMMAKSSREIKTGGGSCYAFNLKYREERSPIDFMQISWSVGRSALRARLK